MAGGSTSNKARGKELGSKLHTTGGARSSRPFVSGGLLCMMGLWSSRNQATRMILACPQRGLRTTGRNLASYKRSGFGGVCGRRCGEFSFGSPSNYTFESISGPSRRTPRTTTTTTTPQRPQRPRRLSWSPSHSSAAHHASLCTARLRAAAASELTPPKAEARAPRCGGVELPSRATRHHAPRALANCTSPTTARSRRACAPRELSAARRARMWRNGPWVDPIGVQVASPRPNTRGGAWR